VKLKPLRYRGRRTNGVNIVEVQQIEDGPWFPLREPYAVAFGPPGFDWGRDRAAAPARRLAIALASSRIEEEEEEEAVDLADSLYLAVVTNLDMEWWMLEGADLDLKIHQLRPLVNNNWPPGAPRDWAVN
jgi:hypothetical protein